MPEPATCPTDIELHKRLLLDMSQERSVETVLTLIVTPSLLALRVWVTTYAVWLGKLLARLTAGRSSQIAQDMAIGRSARDMQSTEIVWEDGRTPREVTSPNEDSDPTEHPPTAPIKAAE